MAKSSIKLLGPDKPLYVRYITLRLRTIYPTHLSFTSDKQFAAIFESETALQDALDALNLFCKYEASVVPPHRNSIGMHYVDFL
jgi:hypothetical protein